MVKLEIYTPYEYVEKLRDALNELGACKVGEYDHVISYHTSNGYWRPLENSKPYQGEKGMICAGQEVKMEVRCPIHLVKHAIETIQTLHPYEEPLINVVPLLDL